MATKQQIEAGRGYEVLHVPALFSPWTKHVFKAINPVEGEHVLDIACGTGVLARHARSRVGSTGRVVGVDPAPGMIAVARESEPAIEWSLGCAEQLEFSDASFDCVVSQFGMMFFQDREAAVNEMSRVLKRGGRVAIAVWNSLDYNPAYRAIVEFIDNQLGASAADALRLPFSMGNPEDVDAVVGRSGFMDTSVETKTDMARFPSIRAMIEAELRGWLPMFGITLDEDRIAEILEISDSELAALSSPNGEAVFQTSALIISARK